MNMHGVLLREIRGLYDGELQMAETLIFLEGKAQASELAEVLDEISERHPERVARLKELSDNLGFRPAGENFRVFRGFLQDAVNRLRSMLPSTGTDIDVANTALMATQLEIVGYETVAELVVALKRPQVNELIQEALEEKYAQCQALRNAIAAILRLDSKPINSRVAVL